MAESEQRQSPVPPAPTARPGDPIPTASDVNDAVGYSGGWGPIAQGAAFYAHRAAPLVLGALGAGGGIPTGLALGAVVPGAAKSVYDALPLPGNRQTPIRQAGAGYRRDFYNDLNRGNYGRAVNDALLASGMTLGRFLADLPPPVPEYKP